MVVKAKPGILVDQVRLAVAQLTLDDIGIQGSVRGERSGVSVGEQAANGVAGALLVAADNSLRPALGPASDVQTWNKGALVQDSAVSVRDEDPLKSPAPTRPPLTVIVAVAVSEAVP